MLKITKSTTVTGYSVIGGVNVVSLYANISQDGNADNISTSILDKNLFMANKTVCRKDMNDFQDEVDVIVEQLTKKETNIETSK